MKQAGGPSPSVSVVGWMAYHTIGVVFAVVFVALASDEWLARPTLLPAPPRAP